MNSGILIRLREVGGSMDDVYIKRLDKGWTVDFNDMECVKYCKTISEIREVLIERYGDYE